MKGFSAHPTRTVVLTHGGQSHSLVLSPPPIGYGEMLAELLPAPPAPRALPGREVAPDLLAAHALADTKHSTRRLMLVLAKCLGPELETQPPAGSASPGAWATYADAVQAEFVAANLLEGDIQALWIAVEELKRGLGDLPKVS